MADLDKLLYDVNVTCPVCSETFQAQRVRKSALIPDGRDADFYVRYRTFDPTDYSVWQCPACGYANADTSFDELNPAERHVLREALRKVEPLAVPRERDLATVMALFERAVFAATTRNSRSRAAGMYLRMAWVHRREGNIEEERKYLAHAYDNYLEAYQSEPFPLGKMSELTVQYLLGELARRLGRFTESVQYFAGVTQARNHNEMQIVNMAKEQWEIARQQAAAATAEAESQAAPATSEQAEATPEAADEAVASAEAAAAVEVPEPAAAAVLVGVSMLPSQLEWLQAVARASGAGLDRSAVLQAVLAVAETISPDRLAQGNVAELAAAIRAELAGGR